MQADAVSCSSNTTTSNIATALQQQQPSSTTTNQLSSDTSSDSGLSIAQVTEEEDTSSPESSRSYRPDRRKQRRNPAVLVQWIEEHNSNPYPTKTEKQHLAALSGTTLRQLNDWFANARRNIKKLGYHTWRKKKGIPGCSTTNAPGHRAFGGCHLNTNIVPPNIVTSDLAKLYNNTTGYSTGIGGGLSSFDKYPPLSATKLAPFPQTTPTQHPSALGPPYRLSAALHTPFFPTAAPSWSIPPPNSQLMTSSPNGSCPCGVCKPTLNATTLCSSQSSTVATATALPLPWTPLTTLPYQSDMWNHTGSLVTTATNGNLGVSDLDAVKRDSMMSEIHLSNISQS